MSRLIAVGLLIAACLFAGCGRKNDLGVVPTSGTVTHNGQPVADLFLNFEPASGRPSWALTDANGQFNAVYTSHLPGVLPGECRVWVTIRPKSVEEEQQLLKGNLPRAVELADLLKKYGRKTSPLNLTIAPGQGPITLQLD